MYFMLLDSESDDDEQVEIVRRPRVFRKRINFRFQSFFEFNERFRLSSVKMEVLSNAIGHRLQHETQRNYALSVQQQIQIALHWFGTGCQYHSVGDMHGVSKATVHRCIKRVTMSINRVLGPQLIRWPNNMMEVVRGFNRIGGLPLVTGAVDGVLIPIDGPNVGEEAFVDRYGDHSINVMAVCGPDSKFYFINSNWPGSVHDARVLRNSSLYRRMETGCRPIENGYIIGDSAYPLKNWLITPIVINPNDPAQIQFIRRHRQTRSVIEQAFGILKEKFPCLNHLRIQPEFAANIIKCCAALCNYARDGDNLEIQHENFPNFRRNDEPLPNDNVDVAGRQRLQEIIQHFR
jgi:hypothetical protein